MEKLNLTAKGKEQELILAYLEENVSEDLAFKINCGACIEKGDIRVINKKTLDGFMKYANEEARKLAEKGANAACIECSVVYGWAMHYFEENSIEEKLYNADGSEYVEPAKVRKVENKPTKIEPPKSKEQQTSFFDLLEETEDIAINTPNENSDTDNITIESKDDVDIPNENSVIEDKKEVAPFYTKCVEVKKANPDSIVFIRLGDFYEAHSEDAITASKELELTLTSRDVGLKERVPLIGIPYHASDVYFSKLQKKFSIVFIESNDKIRKLEKIKSNEKLLVDMSTGEIFDENTEEIESENIEEYTSPFSLDSFDKPTMQYLYELLDGKMDIY